MTTGAAPTLVRAIETAAAAREGAHILSYTTTGRISLKAGDPTILGDVDLLKVGTFNGWTFTASDLEAIVEHFDSLAAGGIFTPPVRLDHSWSILQVVGYIDAVRTAQAVDPTTEQLTTYLRGDLRITEPAALDLIKRGTAVNRSSELGPYETNAGITYPLILYGVAFVDIPAVEGLRPIELSRRYGSPRTVTTLTEGSAMTTETAEAKAQREAAEKAAADAKATAPAATDPPEPSGTPAAPATSAPQTGEPTVTSPPEGETETQRELREMREERAELRREAAETDVARFRDRGVIVQGNEAHARTLLGHEDKAVRDAARGLLGAMAPPVALGQKVGVIGQQSTTGGPTTIAAGAGGEVDLSGKTPDEVGDWWASLDTAQRKADTPEHKAFSAWRAARAAG